MMAMTATRPNGHVAPPPPPPEERLRLEARNVFRIFAPDSRPALAMLRAGSGKDEVFAKLNAVVGVNAASFAVRPGEIFVIMGSSGSGKSTLVRLLNRLIEPCAGEVMLDGQDLTKMTARELVQARRQTMSFVFQSFALMAHLTALDNAAFGLTMAGVAKAPRRAAAMAALETVGLQRYAARYPHEMSGGMQQRVGLARALAKNPSIMFMDEAFSALDPLIRTEMQDELLRLQELQQRTIVFITHDLDEAMRIGDRIAIMENGRIVQVGTSTEILLNPADAYVRSFFRNVDVAKVLHLADVAEPALHAWPEGETATAAHAEALAAGRERHAQLVDAGHRWVGSVDREGVQAAARDRRPLSSARLAQVRPLDAGLRLGRALGDLAEAVCPLPILGEGGRLLGTISQAQLLRLLHRAE